MTITYEIATGELASQHTAVVRATIPVSELASWLPAAYRQVAHHLQRAGVAAAGLPFARYRVLDRVVAVEAGFPVTVPIAGDGRVIPGRLPAGPVVITTHIGRYEELGAACAATSRWLAEHGHTPAGPHWEIYFTDPNAEPDPMRWRTEVVVPYRADRSRHVDAEPFAGPGGAR